VKKIGILGGTFDPPHFGHIHLALSLLEAHALEEVWWIPVQVSPFKLDWQTVSAFHRIEMLKRALEPFPFFKWLEIETLEPGPSYTVETLRKLKARFPDASFFLLMGEDAAAHFEYWKEPREILHLATLLVGSRENPYLSEVEPRSKGQGMFRTEFPFGPEIKSALQKGWTVIPRIEISATAIRNRLKNGLYCGHLMPAKVLDYIEQHQLY
jgi:nicotinate-nucleotide adenylyltransferase